MITFLITPAKSRRDSLLFETPACKLQFDVAETPALFDSLSVNQLKKLHTLNDSKLLQTVRTTKSSRDSLCNLSICGELPFNRQSLCSINGELPGYDSPSPVVRCFDFESDGLTPANIFNQTLTKIHDEMLADDDHKEQSQEDEACSLDNNHPHRTYPYQATAGDRKMSNEYDEENDIVSSTQYNEQWCITMLITKQQLSQQKIYQYLIAKNSNLLLPRHLHIIKSCDCIPCKHRNWNVVDIRWEKQWQSQQFMFNTDFDFDALHDDLDSDVAHNLLLLSLPPYLQIIDVHCDNISHILRNNGILQKEVFCEAQKTFYRKTVHHQKAPNSNRQKLRKKRKRCQDLAESTSGSTEKKRANDKKIMLQHLNTWSSMGELPTSRVMATECKLAEESECEHEEVEYLPLECKEDNGCSYISSETLMQILTGCFAKPHLFDYFVIIDCRYDYEYLGGHIRGAINVSDQVLMEMLFKANMNLREVRSQRIAWIFHCEYSKHRGPQTCKYFRKLDREMNEHRYPHISYPHVYVLQGGYKKFWNRYKDSYWTLKHRIFEPFGYVSMWNEVFDDRRFIFSQFRTNVWKKDKKKNQTKLTGKNLI
eukprot:CAMPEP_0197025362 /NCGR_PEP_ID=MMETSP1384-20130603/5729_1 /TAXON_ID=29189 /ORGANISM="Ammonia sp." /LENGTH=594 /DNA_ID=CAMNT_0042453889 /DNA_START=81 /DNA_END=1865 /DNA_ORIENTATION=+